MRMISDDAIRAEAKTQGLRIKRNNLLAAVLSGSVSGLDLPPSSSSRDISPQDSWAASLLGFFYANGFEYCLHRFLLHSGRGIFSQQHMVHHTTLQSPEAARYVNFSSNPVGSRGAFFRERGAIFVAAVDFRTLAGPRECLRASRFTTSRLKKFTGARTWAAGCRSGCVPRRGTTCCITRRTRAASTSFFRFLTG